MTGTLLRIFLCEGDRSENRPLYAAIVDELRERGFGGATVLKGIEGFGLRGRVRSSRAVDFSNDLPVVIEVIDSEERIRAVIPRLSELIADGLLTLEKVEFMPIRSAAE